MQKLTIRQALKKTQDARGIKSKDLAEKVGIGVQHLASIRNEKSWPSEEVLMKILDAMEQMSPGAKGDFAREIAGTWEEKDLAQVICSLSPSDLLQVLGSRQFAALISAFAENLHQEEANAALENRSSLRKSPHDSRTPTVYKEVMVS